MNDLLTTILKNITTKPDAVAVSMTQEGDVEVYTISVDPEDIGRVIGKSGKVIRAIRSLAHVSAVHAQKKVRVHLDDSNSPAPQAPMAAPEEMVAPEIAMPAEENPVEGEVDLTMDAQPLPEEPIATEEPASPELSVEQLPDTADLLPEEPAK